MGRKEKEWEATVNGLKTEISTLKLNRLMTLPGNSPGGGFSSARSTGTSHRGELERLRDQDDVKSEQILQLRRELILLKSKLDAQVSK